jgi:hypothetical protein
MSGINLLPKDKQVAGPMFVAKHWTVMLTSVVLVIYLVVMAGVIGWWLFLTTQDKLTTSKIAETEDMIRQAKVTESLVWETGNRAGLIQSFLSTRVGMASVAATILPVENVVIAGYKYSENAKSITAVVSDLSELEKYTTRLKKTFPKVTSVTVANDGSSSWKAEINL